MSGTELARSSSTPLWAFFASNTTLLHLPHSPPLTESPNSLSTHPPLARLSCLSLLRSSRASLPSLARLNPRTSLLSPALSRSASFFTLSSERLQPSLPAITSKNTARPARPPPSRFSSSTTDDKMAVDTPSASVDNSSKIPQRVGDFALLTSGELEFAPITVSKWISLKTGLKVVYADVESPLVQAYMPIVTEIFDDSGRPHTLEHLVRQPPSQLSTAPRSKLTAGLDCRSLWAARNTLTRAFVSLHHSALHLPQLSC